MNVAARIQSVETLLGYTFVDKTLLIRALTRKAYAQEQQQHHYHQHHQKVFCTLGDRVLSLVLTELLIQRGCDSCAEINDGKKALESRKHLGRMTLAKKIAKSLFLGVGEQKQQCHKQTSVIAETFEAVVAAIYEDGGLEVTKKLIAKWFVI